MTQARGIPHRRYGLWLSGLGLVVLVVILIIGVLLYYGRLGRSKPRASEVKLGEPAEPAIFVQPSNGAQPRKIPIDEEAKREREAILTNLKEQKKFNEWLKAELERVQQEKRQPRSEPLGKPSTPVKEKRPYAPVVFLSRDRATEQNGQKHPTSTLTAGTFIPVIVETTLVSEIPGYFTLKTRRPVMDRTTGQKPLIPAGQSIIAKAETANLLFGNERVPAFSLTLNLPSGQSVDLGQSPILDATGTNGLTGEVDNHTWRLIWTSIFIGGLRGGQQVLQHSMPDHGGGYVAEGIARESSSTAQQRLGRAQDSRPTISVAAGEVANILITKDITLTPEVK